MASRLILATHNPGKLEELRVLASRWGGDVRSVGELGGMAPAETSPTFLGNARLKAKAAFDAFGHLALGDDGGLVVPSLEGLPGVQSSRWVEAHGGWVAAREALCEQAGLLADPGAIVEAYLVCALAFFGPDGQCGEAEARIEGRLRWPPGADHESYGPGFLPIFEAHPPAIWVDGVLRHRRAAFDAISADLALNDR